MMTERPKHVVPYPFVARPADGADTPPTLLRDLTALEQMYAYFGCDRA